MEWTIELVLVVLLVATLLQAIKLERALGVLKKDRASLEALVASFNASTHQAESGIQRLHAAADGAGRQIESQIARSVSLKDDLVFLTERGERLADRLDAAGITILTCDYEAVELGGGGLHCSTAPLVRDPI